VVRRAICCLLGGFELSSDDNSERYSIFVWRRIEVYPAIVAGYAVGVGVMDREKVQNRNKIPNLYDVRSTIGRGMPARAA
jgi:hypothetical protein